MSSVFGYRVFEKKLFEGSRSVAFNIGVSLDFSKEEDEKLCCFETNNNKLEVQWAIKGSRVEKSLSEGKDSESDASDDSNDISFRLDQLVLLECNQNIHGSFVFRKDDDHYGFSEIHGTFDSNLGLCAKDLNGITLTPSDHIVYMSMFIFHEDADDKRVIKSFLVDDYDKFFENEKLRDVTFVVAGEEIRAHLQILSARNEVFAKMFDSGMIEGKNNKVEIPDVEPNIFKLLLKFIYSDKFESKDVCESLKLLVAADKYSVDNLVHKCGLCVSDNLTTENVVEVLLIADLVNVKFLKKRCIDLVIKNKEEVAETESYKEIVKSGRANLLSEIFLETPKVTSRLKFPKNLTTDNIVATLIRSDLEQKNDLKKKCIKLIIQRKNQVAKTEGYKKMVECGRADLLSEIFLQANL